MRYIHYAIQGKDGKWTGFLQKSWEAHEHGDEGSVRWLDPTKRTYDTEEEALAGALKLAEDGGIKEVFAAVDEKDYRMGVVDLAAKDATGTDTEKWEAATTAETTERARIDQTQRLAPLCRSPWLGLHNQPR